MAEPTQIIGAAFGLADHALKLARLLQKLARARTEAKDLYDDAAQLHSLAARVATVLKDREHNDRLKKASSSQQNVDDTLTSIGSSITSCKRAVLIIHRTVTPLAEESENTWIQRIKYVWSTDVIQAQEKLIVLHLQLLGVNLQILHSLDQAQMMQMMRSVLDYSHRLQGNAKEEQSLVVRSVAKLKEGAQGQGNIDTSDVLAGPSGADEEEDASVLEPTSPIDAADKQDIADRTFPKYLDTNAAPLAVAVRRQEADEVRQLLAAGLDRAAMDADDWTLIHHASYHLDRSTLTQLLSDPEKLPAGFLDAATRRGDTALMLVSKQADNPTSYDVAEQLLTAGCDVNVVNKGETDRDALYYVVEHSKTANRLKFVTLLTEHNVDTTLARKAFPDGIKQWPSLRGGGGGGRSTEEAVDDGDADEETMDPIQRRESWTDKFKRKLSLNRSPGTGEDGDESGPSHPPPPPPPLPQPDPDSFQH